MTSTAVRRVALLGTLAVLLTLLFASPAAAHAELVTINPANGAQLSEPPTKVQLRFTESVNLIDGGIRLVDDEGVTVPTSDPTVDRNTVTWPMPELSEGAYVVTWRVVSSDGHPISGASSFGVGTAAAAVPAADSADPSSSELAAGSTAPLAVITSRLAGYVAFALFAGVAAFVLLCAPDASKNPTLQLLVRGGILGGAVTAVAALLVQGPYTAGVSVSQMLDTRLLPQTLDTPFGTAMMWRLGLYVAIGVLVWRLPRILTPLGGWLLPAGVAGIAVTIAAAGHAGASGLIGLGVDALHALTAGLWVGGLVALVVLGRSVEPRVLHQFSTLAIASVLTLIVTGTLNSLLHLDAIEELWRTRYGLTLLIKLTLVAGTLGAAAVSRRRVQQHRVPRRSIWLEAALTVAVFAITAMLSTTSPPPRGADPAIHAGHVTEPAAASEAVQMSLRDQGNAALSVTPATTGGSHLHLVLVDPNGRPLAANGVTLKVANPGRDIAPIPVEMSMLDGAWVANYRFPFPGTWKAILTVEGIGPSAVVTAADMTIRD
jgi:copper transport protein